MSADRSPTTTRRRSSSFLVRPTMRSPATTLGPRANRAIARILEATRSIFLTRGYAGTTIDEIAKVAGLSRASFYTYFPTKRDALLALGEGAADAADAVIEAFGRRPRPFTDADITAFVDDYFALMDEHGSFAFAWTQAAHEDGEIRKAGMKRHFEMCRHLGTIIAPHAAKDRSALNAKGIVIFSMFERSWDYCQLYTGSVDVATVRREVVHLITSMLDDAA